MNKDHGRADASERRVDVSLCASTPALATVRAHPAVAGAGACRTHVRDRRRCHAVGRLPTFRCRALAIDSEDESPVLAPRPATPLLGCVAALARDTCAGLIFPGPEPNAFGWCPMAICPDRTPKAARALARDRAAPRVLITDSVPHAATTVRVAMGLLRALLVTCVAPDDAVAVWVDGTVADTLSGTATRLPVLTTLRVRVGERSAPSSTGTRASAVAPACATRRREAGRSVTD